MNKRLANGLSWGLMFMVPLLVFSCMGTGTISSSSEAPPEVMEAAKEGLAELSSIVPNTPKEGLALGDYFEIMAIPSDAIMSATKEASSVIESTGMWQVMVLSDGAPYLMMFIDKNNGKYDVAARGAMSFTRELFQVRKAWLKNRLSTIRVYEASADLIQVFDQKGQEVGFVPLTSAVKAFGLQQRFNPTNVISGSSVMSASQRAITASRSQHQQ